MKTINYKYNSIYQPLKVVNEGTDIEKIWRLRQSEYGKYYPAMNDAANDAYDDYSCILYSENDNGNFTSTGRMVLDSEAGLPAEKITPSALKSLRTTYKRIAEPGRFAIAPEGRGLLPLYLKTYYRLALDLNINLLIFITRNKNMKFYQREFSAEIIEEDIGYSYGTDYHFALFALEVSTDLPRFMRA